MQTLMGVKNQMVTQGAQQTERQAESQRPTQENHFLASEEFSTNTWSGMLQGTKAFLQHIPVFLLLVYKSKILCVLTTLTPGSLL